MDGIREFKIVSLLSRKHDILYLVSFGVQNLPQARRFRHQKHGNISSASCVLSDDDEDEEEDEPPKKKGKKNKSRLDD